MTSTARRGGNNLQDKNSLIDDRYVASLIEAEATKSTADFNNDHMCWSDQTTPKWHEITLRQRNLSKEGAYLDNYRETHDNRYYSRGTDNSGVGYEKLCDRRRLHHNRANANRVWESNNPYSEDFPSFAVYSPFSIFGSQQLTFHDFENALRYYNQLEIVPKAEELYGPFNQRNYNIISETAYNDMNWSDAWKKYQASNHYKTPQPSTETDKTPFVFQVATTASNKFLSSFNASFWHLGVQNNLFHIGKSRVFRIMRSEQTGWLRFEMVVSLIRDTEREAREFEFRAYFDPHTSTIKLGKATYLGITTSSRLILPPGFDPTEYQTTGRPLHPLQARKNELMPEQEARDLYVKHMVKSSSFRPKYAFDDSLPAWFLTRQPPPRQERGRFGSTAAMFPDAPPETLNCLDGSS